MMMGNTNDSFNPFDPTAMFKEVRDSSMAAWAKMMVEVVQSEAYAESTGKMLDGWLSSSAPFRKVMEKSLLQSLGNLKLPSADDVARLHDRLTNIEMRLDDLDAKLDTCSKQS
jgi:hypothetical protein